VLLRTALLLLSISALCPAQTANTVKLYPANPKPLKATAHLTSKEQRVGKWVYQVFYFRNAPQQEAFRVEIGSYEKGQLVKDWSYGIVAEKDMTSDGPPDYVWYGGDDTGQRLLWFRSRENRYDCTDVFKTAATAWKKRFGRAAPDLGDVGGEAQAMLVTWDAAAQFLNITVEDSRQAKVRSVRLRIAPGEFTECQQTDIGLGH
jgi:hypothetical protein